MSESSAVQASPAREYAQASDVLALLREASKRRSLALVRGVCHPVDGGGESRSDLSLGARLLEFMKSGGATDERRDSELFQAEDLPALGHAPFWANTGELYEELLAHLQNEDPPEYVFCLDPWSAQILSRLNESCPSAKWIVVSDLGSRKAEGETEYWEKLEEWFRGLPLHAIVPVDVLVSVIAGASASPTEPSFRRVTRSILEKAGAWQWKSLREPKTASRRALQGQILFISPFSGSLLHLQVFLRCLRGQEYPKSRMGLLLLARQGSLELDTALKWNRHVHPELQIGRMTPSEGEPEGWKREVRAFISENPSVRVAWVHDHLLLPAKLAKSLDEADRDGIRLRLGSLPLPRETSARILVGELDPVGSYETLITPYREAFQEAIHDPPLEHGFLLPSCMAAERETELLAHIGAFFECAEPPFSSSGHSNDCDPIGLLRLGDEP